MSVSSDTSWKPSSVGMDGVARRVWSLRTAKPSAFVVCAPEVASPASVSRAARTHVIPDAREEGTVPRDPANTTEFPPVTRRPSTWRGKTSEKVGWAKRKEREYGTFSRPTRTTLHRKSWIRKAKGHARNGGKGASLPYPLKLLARSSSEAHDVS
eukprot:scaffold1401_cov330-Pavlova_lutheri.AAC.52